MFRGSAWLQRGEQRCARQRLIGQLLLQKGEFGVISRRKFASEGFANYNPVARHD
jgi:hypothetical protein